MFRWRMSDFFVYKNIFNLRGPPIPIALLKDRNYYL